MKNINDWFYAFLYHLGILDTLTGILTVTEKTMRMLFSLVHIEMHVQGNYYIKGDSRQFNTTIKRVLTIIPVSAEQFMEPHEVRPVPEVVPFGD